MIFAEAQIKVSFNYKAESLSASHVRCSLSVEKNACTRMMLRKVFGINLNSLENGLIMSVWFIHKQLQLEVFLLESRGFTLLLYSQQWKSFAVDFSEFSNDVVIYQKTVRRLHCRKLWSWINLCLKQKGNKAR